MDGSMRLRIVAVAIDALDPRGQAEFWSQALHWQVGATEADGVVQLLPTDGVTTFRLDFVPVTEPKTTRSRLHFDLTTESVAAQLAMVDRLTALGASHLDVGQTAEDTHIVLADPEGNAFCLIAPGNNFLSTCPRLGCVSCDGTHDVGVFWSAALGWPLVWDEGEETAIQAPTFNGPKISWGGPPVMNKFGKKNRLHFDIAPPLGGDQQFEVERLIAIGARRIDIGQGDVDWVVMADPDDNEFCVLKPQ